MPSTSLAVAACLESLADESCTCDGIIARRINSRIHRATCKSRIIAIKECLSATLTPEPSAAEREFGALTKLAEIASAPGSQPLAPLPVVLCREHAAYAMTWVPGRPATELILALSTDHGQAAALGEAAGLWLRRFHALRPLPVRESDFASKLEFVTEILEAGGDRDPLLRRASKRLAVHASAASAQRMPASWVHGDMKSDNLLVIGDRVTGLDVQLVDENIVAYDLAPFLNHLRLLGWSPRWLWHRRKLKLMAEGFLRAYSSETVHWKLPITWLRVYLLLQILAPSKKFVSLPARAVRWPARIELARAIDELDDCR